MKQGIFKITKNFKIAKDVFLMCLSGDTSAISAPGQFINIQLSGKFLRRPISVCDYGSNSVTIIYKVVGSGTEYMSELQPGEELDILTGLGNGFDTEKSGENPVLVGGGVGVPPMYSLAKRLLAAGKTPAAILGFNTASEIFYKEEFEALGIETILATADGSVGSKGFVTDALPEAFDTFCACGPMPMLRALCARTEKSGFLSLEARMGCGFGACMGCSCKVLTGGYKRICKDGPVLERKEIVWTQA